MIHLQSKGVLTEYFKEHIFESFEIRLPDIDKEPFREDGTIILPIRERDQEWRKMGLQSIYDPPPKGSKDQGNPQNP